MIGDLAIHALGSGMRACLVAALLVLTSTAEASPCVEEASLDGLWICGKPTAAPSHGGESFVRTAHYTLENRGPRPVVVELRSLEVLDPAGKPLALAIDYANFLPAPNGVTRATIAPGKTHELVIFGKGSTRGLQYHVVYRHRVRFRVDGVEQTVRASELYFRHPRRDPRLTR